MEYSVDYVYMQYMMPKSSKLLTLRIFNDIFVLKGIEFFSSSEVSIFNRQGKLLKYSRNNPFSWNGTFKNNKLPTDDYWYAIIIDGHNFSGSFTLKR